jgi:hypothetical protein
MGGPVSPPRRLGLYVSESTLALCTHRSGGSHPLGPSNLEKKKSQEDCNIYILELLHPP